MTTDSFFALRHQDLTTTLCLGVAGNFAGHLEQAGETPDFVNVKTASANAPKGLFPYYIPNQSGLLGQFPLSATEIRYPQNLTEEAHLQAEPEVCVLFAVEYADAAGRVKDLIPKAFAAFNDCSIRKPGAKKISEKKNWGLHTKGLAEQFIALTHFAEGCELDKFRIASYLKRENQVYAYGNDSSVLTYAYFHETLQNWMIEQLNHQVDFGPLENLQDILKTAGYPNQILVSLGATTYTEVGKTVFLQPGDEVSIYVYDSEQNSQEDVFAHLLGENQTLKNSSILQQKITPPEGRKPPCHI